MRKTIVCLSLSILLMDCNRQTPNSIPGLKARQDTAFSKGSGIKNVELNDHNIADLTNLGMLWGFLKYYHADVNNGAFNMDAELFRVLPKVLRCSSSQDANKVLEQWVDGFGVPQMCKECIDLTQTDSTKFFPDFGFLFTPQNLPATLQKKLEYIKHHRTTAAEHYYVVKAVNNNVDFRNELPYDQTSYPDCGVRLLSLFRYWNMVHFFFPYRYLTGEDWNKVLHEFVPEFCHARSAIEYQLTCLKLISRIHDSHAYLLKNIPREIDSFKGEYFAPFRATFLEGKLVVKECFTKNDTYNTGSNEVKVGDVISKIDGVPVDELVKNYLPITSASNYETQLRELCYYKGHLLRHRTPNMAIETMREGRTETKDVLCIRYDEKTYLAHYPVHDTRPWKIMKGNIGYVFPENLKEDDLDSMKVAFKDTKGIIFDLRCYPSVFMIYTYGAWLKQKRSPFCFATVPDVHYPGYFEYTNAQMNGDSTGIHYTGKVVIIVNEETQSLGELTAMAIRSVRGAKILGSKTAGADGYVSPITLPGGIKTQISGLGVMNLDSTETQRAGVQIDNLVYPTIKGFKAGRDELLEAAVEMVSSK